MLSYLAYINDCLTPDRLCVIVKVAFCLIESLHQVVFDINLNDQYYVCKHIEVHVVLEILIYRSRVEAWCKHRTCANAVETSM